MTRVWLCLGLISGLSCASPVSPSAATTPVDVLEFIIGDPALWPRTGDQLQHQLLEDHRVCWVKYGNAAMFECWRWDDQWVYHDIDHGLDGDRAGESYRFTDGRWLPRYLTDTWHMDISENHIRWFTRDCLAVQGPEGIPIKGSAPLFPYRVRAWFEAAHVISPDLGTRDVLVLEYAPHAPNRASGVGERFYFARGAGWYRWISDRGSRTFADQGGPRVMRGTMCPL